ncbi:hypothetical protein DFJ73DRAFT_803561 [Zopfochytrium polystomum]|nr:hypothetical protein DFJ73DRAFT_803561 [Zopfochytrium polystomum]
MRGDTKAEISGTRTDGRNQPHYLAPRRAAPLRPVSHSVTHAAALIMFTPSNIVPPLSVPRTRNADPPSFEPSARLSQTSASQPPPPPRLPLDLLPEVLKFLHPHRLIHPLPFVSRAVCDHIRQHLIPSRAFAASNIALCGADINTVALSRFPADSYWRAAVAVHGFTIDVADAVLRPPASAPAKGSRRLTDGKHYDEADDDSSGAAVVAYVSHSPDRPPVLTITSPSPAVRAAASLLAPIAVEWLQRRRQQSSTASSGGGTALLFPLQFAVAFTCAPVLAAALPLPSCLCDDDTSNWTSVGGSYPALLRCWKPAEGGGAPSSACPRATRLAENLLWTLVWARSSGGGFVDDEGDREFVVRSVVGALIGSYGRGPRRAAVSLIRDAVEGATESGNQRVAVALKGALRELDATEEGGAALPPPPPPPPICPACLSRSCGECLALTRNDDFSTAERENAHVAHPYHILLRASFDITVASPKGGATLMDPIAEAGGRSTASDVDREAVHRHRRAPVRVRREPAQGHGIDVGAAERNVLRSKGPAGDEALADAVADGAADEREGMDEVVRVEELEHVGEQIEREPRGCGCGSSDALV